MKVYIAAVTHKQGINLYAGGSRQELLWKLAGYVREQGGPEAWPGSYSPKDQAEIDGLTDEQVVDLYFQDHPAEFVDEDQSEVSAPKDIQQADFDDSFRPAGIAIEGRPH